jgi:hypothetical protein
VRLVVLHVVHDPLNMPGYYARIARKKTLTRMEDIAAEMLDAFVGRVARQKHPQRQALHKPELLLVKGIPVTRILQVAQKQKAGMLVHGQQGRHRTAPPAARFGRRAGRQPGQAAGHHRQGTAEELISTHRRRQQHESRTVAPSGSRLCCRSRSA